MKQGDPVEVRIVWACGQDKLADWFGGYTFVEYDVRERSVLVDHPDGHLVRYTERDVRMATGGGVWRVRARHELRQAIVEADRAFAEALS